MEDGAGSGAGGRQTGKAGLGMNYRLPGGAEAPVHAFNTVIVGSGAAGMNCAVHLHEFMSQKGVERPEDRIAIVTGGIGLGASRMSG